MWSMNALPILPWVSFECSGFLPQSKNMYYMLTGVSELVAYGMTESSFLWMCMPFGMLAPAQGWFV